jgi:hypothetical protein
MGGVPLYMIIVNALAKNKDNGIGTLASTRLKALSINVTDGQNVLDGTRGKILLIVEIAAIAAGIFAATRMFNNFTGK